MLAQRKYQTEQPIAVQPRRRRKINPLARWVQSPIVRILVLAAAAVFVATIYVGAYAKATEKGYDRARLLSHLREVKLENECFRMQIEELRQPDRIAAFAAGHKMVEGERMAYLRPVQRSRVAQNPDY
jgi:hypothetical protein